MFGRVDELKPMANKTFCYFFCTGFISVSAYFPLAEKLFLWWQPLARERESRDRFSSRSWRRSLIVISLSFVRASGLLPFAMMFGDCVEYRVELCVCGREMRAELMRFLLRVYLWRISYWRLVECGGCCFVLYRQFRVCPLRRSEYSEAWTEFLIYKLGCEGIISRTLQVLLCLSPHVHVSRRLFVSVIYLSHWRQSPYCVVMRAPLVPLVWVALKYVLLSAYTM